MGNEKIMEILAQAGLTGAHAQNHAARQIAAGVLSAQQKVTAVAADIAKSAGQLAVEPSAQGLLSTQGTPMLSLTSRSLELDAALVSVRERHTALGVIAQVITGGAA